MKKMISALFVAYVVAVSGAFAAQECSYVIDEVTQKNDLAHAALNKLKIDIEKIRSVRFDAFRFYESKPTPMCPEELTYVGDATLSFVSDEGGQSARCTARVNAVKVEPWGRLKRAPKIAVTVIQPAVCLQ